MSVELGDFRHLKVFEHMLIVATGKISKEYFQLPVADADAVYRERVYCYELYHQLRCLWGDFPFSLGGEIDKLGHPHFQNGPYAQAKPDLLVHLPDSMDSNLVCIEVKPFDRSLRDFADDLKKLTWFCCHAKYYCGIFLVYGTTTHVVARGVELSQKVLKASAKLGIQVDLSRIHVFHHGAVGEKAKRVGLVTSGAKKQD